VFESGGAASDLATALYDFDAEYLVCVLRFVFFLFLGDTSNSRYFGRLSTESILQVLYCSWWCLTSRLLFSKQSLEPFDFSSLLVNGS
jgi:hypothetical protein